MQKHIFHFSGFRFHCRFPQWFLGRFFRPLFPSPDIFGRQNQSAPASKRISKVAMIHEHHLCRLARLVLHLIRNIQSARTIYRDRIVRLQQQIRTKQFRLPHFSSAGYAGYSFPSQKASSAHRCSCRCRSDPAVHWVFGPIRLTQGPPIFWRPQVEQSAHMRSASLSMRIKNDFFHSAPGLM